MCLLERLTERADSTQYLHFIPPDHRMSMAGAGNSPDRASMQRRAERSWIEREVHSEPLARKGIETTRQTTNAPFNDIAQHTIPPTNQPLTGNCAVRSRRSRRSA